MIKHLSKYVVRLHLECCLVGTPQIRLNVGLEKVHKRATKMIARATPLKRKVYNIRVF